MSTHNVLEKQVCIDVQLVFLSLVVQYETTQQSK